MFLTLDKDLVVLMDRRMKAGMLMMKVKEMVLIQEVTLKRVQKMMGLAMEEMETTTEIMVTEITTMV